MKNLRIRCLVLTPDQWNLNVLGVGSEHLCITFRKSSGFSQGNSKGQQGLRPLVTQTLPPSCLPLMPSPHPRSYLSFGVQSKCHLPLWSWPAFAGLSAPVSERWLQNLSTPAELAPIVPLSLKPALGLMPLDPWQIFHI